MSFTSFNWIRKEPGYRNGGEHFGYLANVFLRSGYGNEVHPSRLNGMAVTQSDCYVSLYLPTASVKTMKTQTIKDSKDPMWNETFHFRIQNKVKNILEFNIYDEDKLTEDDHLLTVLFDVSKIQLGESVPLSFQLNPKGKEELEVEFTMESSPDVPEKILTNGVLVSREVACLEVQVNGGKRKSVLPERTFTLSVGGSYEEAQNLNLGYWLCPASPAKFHYIKYNQSDLKIELPRRQFCADKIIDLSVKAKEWTQWLWFKRPKALDVRLGYGLCSDENNFLQKRKKVVAAALKSILSLGQDLNEHEVPVVAMTTTGAGMRALTALYGTLWGLQRTKLLDCISYMTGSSGTSWTMTKLYEDSNWSNKDLGEIILQARKQAAKSKRSAFSLEKLKSYHKELAQRTIAGYKSSFIDLWGLMIEAMLNEGNNHHKLSEQRRAVNKGQNPLPIYLALNVKDNITTKDFREWLEFTPYEIGFPKYGAFVAAENFGSEFYMGHIMKKLPESRICFMQGLWSSVFSKNLLDAWHAADNSEDFWNRWTQDSVIEIDEVPDILEKPHEMPTRMFTPAGGLSNTLRDILTDRPAVSKYNNFLKGLQMHNEYVQHQQFTKWKDTMLDESPNQLKDSTEHLELVDTAFFFDTSCPPLLRPERKVDVILHFNYTGGSQTKPLEQASTYFSAQGIPFPKILLNEEEKKNIKECYVFEEANNPEAPIVLYFPLVNDTFQRYIAPGIERNAAQLPQGNVDISSAFSPYSTRQVSLQEEDFNKLLNLTNYNVQNNANTILRVLHKVVEQKKQAQLPQSSS
ncbi:cytosolic phospholipase A2 epsilon-like [Protobothrops mucrosquamatus]|uniref:cytosolic phospholipase A2 epsilon-like n=1 Tax=Protobothrops mucrosquamatus TaxID=103944 RepID=UPI0010FBA9D0|nr:cytosolic phospholipase A2 epsilon-like [Protobothrops mucrosquamatus]